MNDHREDYAGIYLKKHRTYILVEKQESHTTTEEDGLISELHTLHEKPVADYTPLLQNCSKLLPKFNLRIQTASPQRPPKSPRSTSKAANGHHANKLPCRKVKRGNKTKISRDVG